MPDLAAAFRDHLQSIGDPRRDGEAAAPDLSQRLEALCARGRAAFPDLPVPDETFVRHLAAIEGAARAGAPPLVTRAVEDLYLACACLHGVSGAVAAFDRRCAGAVRATVARIARSSAVEDEILQALRDAVLVGRPDAPAKIAGYTGSGPLDRWVAVTGQRLALMMIRSQQAEKRAHDAMAAEAAPPADPEVAYLKQRYRGEFEQALAELLQDLVDRDRVVLRLSLVQGASAESIGRIYGVSRATAQRWVEAAREKIADGLQRLLRERLALSASGVGSVAGLVASQLDLSLSQLLRSR